jgi:hypothetical protein
MYDKSNKSNKMSTFSSRAALVIKAIEARRRLFYIEAVRSLVSINSSLILRVRRRRRRRVLEYPPNGFDLESRTDDWCIEFLRFSKSEIREIIPYLRLDLCPWRNRYNATPEVAFYLLLYKLS